MLNVLRRTFQFAPLLVALGLPGCSEGPVEVTTAPTNERAAPPMALAEWRIIQQEGEEAMLVEDIDERIARCYSFVLKHPEHPQTGLVLKTLTESLVMRGDYDPDELVRLLAHRVRLDHDGISEPLRLVRDFHIKYGLPPESALALIDEVRERIRREQAEVSNEVIKFQQEYVRSQLQSQQIDAYVMEARLYLGHGLFDKALAATDEALDVSAEMNKGLIPGHEGSVLHLGAFDSLYLVRAAALEGLGRREPARVALAQSFGALDDPDMLDLYGDLRRTVGLRTESEISVKAEPEVAYAFELETLDGETIRLADYRGRVVLLGFWATWCGACREDIPALQDFEKEHQDLGVEVLTINIDRYAKEERIRRFIEQFGFEAPVLLEDEAQLTDYTYWAIPTLYVIDRDGYIAYKRTGFDPALDDKLARQISDIAAGESESGRDVLTVELAPRGYGVLWKAPHGKYAGPMTIVPSFGDQEGEVVVATGEGLLRWSADGEHLETRYMKQWMMNPRAVDLDGDGRLEWVGSGYKGLIVTDWDGQIYWERGVEINPTMVMSGGWIGAGLDHIAGISDLNGDGFQEIVLGDQFRVRAIQATGKPLWTSRAFSSLEMVVLGPDGEIVVQADGQLYDVDDTGNVVPTNRRAPEGRVLRARLARPDGMIDMFGGPNDPAPLMGFDVDGDGAEDIVVPTLRGVAAYTTEGTPILRVLGHDKSVQIAVGNLDGNVGDEIAVYVSNYGLVVLGRRS